MEQRLIDANKVDAFIDIEYDGREIKSVEEFEKIPTVLTIPENPTNGDMIKALFSGVKLFTNETEIGFRPKGQAWVIWFHIDWWNAPYKPDKED